MGRNSCFDSLCSTEYSSPFGSTESDSTKIYSSWNCVVREMQQNEEQHQRIQNMVNIYQCSYNQNGSQCSSKPSSNSSNNNKSQRNNNDDNGSNDDGNDQGNDSNDKLNGSGGGKRDPF